MNQIKDMVLKRIFADGMNLEKTSEYTGLSIKILEKLRKQ